MMTRSLKQWRNPPTGWASLALASALWVGLTTLFWSLNRTGTGEGPIPFPTGMHSDQTSDRLRGVRGRSPEFRCPESEAFAFHRKKDPTIPV